MDSPRADKVAVVDEVRDRLDASDAAVLTEYRGLTVAELAQLRRELAAAGGDYTVYKNTLVKLAIADGPQAELYELLTGPTAIAFVSGDLSAVAKALRDFARSNPSLVVKGGWPAPACSRPRTSTCWPTFLPVKPCWPSWPAAWPLPSGRWPA